MGKVFASSSTKLACAKALFFLMIEGTALPVPEIKFFIWSICSYKCIASRSPQCVKAENHNDVQDLPKMHLMFNI